MLATDPWAEMQTHEARVCALERRRRSGAPRFVHVRELLPLLVADLATARAASRIDAAHLAAHHARVTRFLVNDGNARPYANASEHYQ